MEVRMIGLLKNKRKVWVLPSQKIYNSTGGYDAYTVDTFSAVLAEVKKWQRMSDMKLLEYSSEQTSKIYQGIKLDYLRTWWDLLDIIIYLSWQEECYCNINDNKYKKKMLDPAKYKTVPKYLIGAIIRKINLLIKHSYFATEVQKSLHVDEALSLRLTACWKFKDQIFYFIPSSAPYGLPFMHCWSI